MDTATTAQSPDGRIEIAESAITAIVNDAVRACYGVVDLAPRSLGSAIGKRLGLTRPGQGIDVAVADGRITVELSLVMEYGTPLFTVARNVMQTVAYQVEHRLGMPVERVNVTVQGLRVSAATAAARSRE